MRTVAITGVTGFLGGEAARAFIAAQWRVIGLARGSSERPANPNVALRHFDLRDAAAVDLDGVDVLIHCALEPYRHAGAAGESMNVTGSGQLFERAAAQGVGKIVFISSTAARAGTLSTYGLEKLAIEKKLDAERDVVVRPGLIVGDGGLFRAMYRSLRKIRVAPIFFGGHQPVYTIGVGDLSAALVRLAEGAHVGTYTLAAKEPTEMRSIYQQLARKADVRALLVPMPYLPTLRLLELVERLGITLPITSGSVKGVASMQPIEVDDAGRLGITIAPFSAALDAVHFSHS